MELSNYAMDVIKNLDNKTAQLVLDRDLLYGQSKYDFCFKHRTSLALPPLSPPSSIKDQLPLLFEAYLTIHNFDEFFIAATANLANAHPATRQAHKDAVIAHGKQRLARQEDEFHAYRRQQHQIREDGCEWREERAQVPALADIPDTKEEQGTRDVRRARKATLRLERARKWWIAKCEGQIEAEVEMQVPIPRAIEARQFVGDMALVVRPRTGG
ncbi:hypothetical protein BJ875DRAFT_491396 [Amylocarpus encephaloides]|uniref:Uncharacterized protein n=1 Tax=Amylocarpus encephaloides TaxID=45428 RepID=A0A9P8CA60_9HELO|nr:hypothetical protein BJ875DRAFT_491396 [Amylocarpus encephaloides]